MEGMPLWMKLILWIGMFSFGTFFAVMALIFTAIQIVKKGWSNVFFMKKRSVPPAGLKDPSLGAHGFAHLEDVRLHYISNGAENKPLMLLVHGFPEFWYSWRNQLREFSDDYRVVAVDQRGYGDSDKPPAVSDYELSNLTNDLRQLIFALGHEKCVLVGHDWGGMVSWAFAMTYPNMVEQLIIMSCPSPAGYMKLLSSSLSYKIKFCSFSLIQVPCIPEMNMCLSDMALLREAFLGTMKSKNMSEEDVETYKYTFQRNGFTAPLNYYRALIRYPGAIYHLISKDLQVKCPTLIIWGCQDTFLDKQLAALSTYSVAGEVSVKYIEDGSHWTPMDQYQEANSYMRDFLDTTGKKSL